LIFFVGQTVAQALHSWQTRERSSYGARTRRSRPRPMKSMAPTSMTSWHIFTHRPQRTQSSLGSGDQNGVSQTPSDAASSRTGWFSGQRASSSSTITLRASSTSGASVLTFIPGATG
jgi:hypothetical protein